MSEKCADPTCGKSSKGSIGMLRYCYGCFAAICGFRANDPRLRGRLRVILTDEGCDMDMAEWVPDVAITRERQEAQMLLNIRAEIEGRK